MRLAAAVGQRVMLRFRKLPEELEGAPTGIYNSNAWIVSRLVAVEDLGVWLENPGYETTRVTTQSGETIPEGDRRSEKHFVHVLIRWEYVETVITSSTAFENGVTSVAVPIGDEKAQANAGTETTGG